MIAHCCVPLPPTDSFGTVTWKVSVFLVKAGAGLIDAALADVASGAIAALSAMATDIARTVRLRILLSFRVAPPSPANVDG
jgi:hypothetical protein